FARHIPKVFCWMTAISGNRCQRFGRWLLASGYWLVASDQWQEASSQGPVTSSLTTEIDER
ncbi:MAG: hypothetical protein KAR15_08415, partial [Desulfobacterales bacterium]|nr:hypothetical protein [Desulfobacterales bacterium]